MKILPEICTICTASCFGFPVWESDLAMVKIENNKKLLIEFVRLESDSMEL